MEYRKLGDLEVSVIGYGAWGIGGAPFWKIEGDKKSIDSIKASFDRGDRIRRLYLANIQPNYR